MIGKATISKTHKYIHKHKCIHKHIHKRTAEVQLFHELERCKGGGQRSDAVITNVVACVHLLERFRSATHTQERKRERERERERYVCVRCLRCACYVKETNSLLRVILS